LPVFGPTIAAVRGGKSEMERERKKGEKEGGLVPLVLVPGNEKEKGEKKRRRRNGTPPSTSLAV